MGTETIHASAVLAATPEKIYAAWLDGDKHAAMTGGPASGQGRVGQSFTAWGDYITGKHLELLPARRIVQAWRTTQFPAAAPDSRLIVLLEREAAGTRVTVVHTDIPQGQGKSYESGWEAHYFAPMRRYFAKATKKTSTVKTSAKKTSTAKTSAKKTSTAKAKKR